MAGENFFFFCIAFLLFLNLWARIKNRRRLAKVNSRIRQLEELLLEVCAILEENREKEEPAASRVARLAAAKEPEDLVEQVEQAKPDEPEKPQEAGEPEEGITSLSPAAGKEDRDRPAGKKAAVGEEPAKGEERDKEEGPASAGGGSGGEKPIPPEQQAADRRRQVLDLYHQGMPVKAIARRIGMGQGEAQLIIDLYGRRGK